MKKLYRFTFIKGMDGTKDAFAIRQEVFVEEQGFTDEFDDIDPIAYHAVLYDGNTLVATGRAFPYHDGLYKIGRVAVRKPYRGKSAGRLLMEKMEEALRELGAAGIQLSSQMQAKGFYDRLGYVAFGETYLDQFCPHTDMKKLF